MNNYLPDKSRPASALLLTVMIIAILTTTTLASIAVRFDQLASTDKIANAAVAKSAADSALIKVKEKLASQTAISSTIFDLDTNKESALTTTPYRPSPRKIVSTYEKVQTSLPRCNGVIVLLPWTNDGQYLQNQANDANPAMIFNYANIVNDTPLGIIPGNGSLGGNGDNPEKQKTISQLTNMGHFYNPFAPLGARQKDLNYWTVKLGGPQDQFLTKKATDGVSSYYKNVDFVYLSYLPRWSDSGIFTATPGTGIDRISAKELREKFESVIKDNNFKVWIDASIPDAQLYQYGFGDLFVDSNDYRLKWLQPSLWNDTPEADGFSTPYKTENAEDSTLKWAKKTQPLMTNTDTNWKTTIIKGAKSFSFIKVLPATNPSFVPGADIGGLIYGSLEGLRLNQLITLVLLDKSQQPVTLLSRGQDQGRLYSAKLTRIDPPTISNGVQSIGVRFTLGTGTYNTPEKISGGPARGSEIDTIAVIASPQFSTTKSIDSVNIDPPSSGGTVIRRSGQDCQVACPAVGDLVSLTKPSAPSTAPVWGKVTNVDYTSGTSFNTFTVDSLRRSPIPTREMAYTYYDQGGPKIAYYGGSVAMNDYDGGYASESDQLWIYDPEADSWTFKAPGATNPGRRAGASMVYDNTSNNNRLVMIGGYYHEWINVGVQGDCEVTQPTCLYTNRPGLRIAKRVTNDVYAFSLASNTWEKIDYTSTFDPTKKIQSASYTARVTSTLAERSGLERWNMTAKTAATNTNQTINVSPPGTKTLGVVLYPSAAGVSKGDEIYLYGNKTDNLGGGNFYAWGKVDAVKYADDAVDIIVYGYKGTELSVTMKSLAIQVVKRQVGTSTCTGGTEITEIGPRYYCLLSDTTGYAVGDSVVLEQYTGNNLVNTLSGFISFIDYITGKAYFVANEKAAEASIKDYSSQADGIVTNESAVSFPSARYGGTFALQPTAPTKASYWEGAAKNINYNHRFADVWNVQFAALPGAAGAAWSIPSTDNTLDPGFVGATYNLQVIKPSYSYQITTTNNSAGGVNPAAVKDKPYTDQHGNSYSIWDDSKRYLLDIDANDGGKVVTGAWATLERRLNTDGTRETFHGIVEDTYTGSPCGSAYSANQLCLRHNPSYPGDSGFATDSKNVKVTMTPSFNTGSNSGGTFVGSADHVSLTNVTYDKLGTVPGVGAMVVIWNNSGNFPRQAYTFIVSRRVSSSVNSKGNFDLYFDKLTASPHPFGYSTSQIAAAAGSSLLVTISEHQFSYDYPDVPEWVKDVAGGPWKIRVAAKNPSLLYRPSPRRGSVAATLYDSGTSKIFLAGGTFGEYGSLWKQTNAGLTALNAAAWVPQYVSEKSSEDIPNLFGGSLVVYKSGPNTKAVYFGGKRKTDLSSADYGSTIGAKMLGRPDNGTFIDNSFYIVDNVAVSDPTAVSLTNTIITNKSASWPSEVDNSLKFVGGDRNDKAACAYIGQTGCTSEELLSQLGNMGRLDDSTTNDPFNGWSWGRTAILSSLGDKFKSQGDTPKASLIMSVPTLSGVGVNTRWEQDGYRPYMRDSVTYGTTFGKLTTDFGSDKTAGLVAYTALNKAPHVGGAIMATSVGIGTAIASNRGGGTGTSLGWHSYCAASDIKKDASNNPEMLNNLYQCKSDASRYLPTLPDAEDMLFLLNAAQALGATDTYKIVGYYGGVKRGYLVTSVSGTLPKVYEIVP